VNDNRPNCAFSQRALGGLDFELEAQGIDGL
jgi:hypothetical protein